MDPIIKYQIYEDKIMKNQAIQLWSATQQSINRNYQAEDTTYEMKDLT
jgi:hypothetical protein